MPLETLHEKISGNLSEPFAIIAPRRGLISRHQTITTATLAYCMQLQTVAAWDDPPHIYEFTGQAWRRV